MRVRVAAQGHGTPGALVSPRALAPCGTNAAYQRHVKRGETVDELCAEAAREYQRKWYAKRKAAPVDAPTPEPEPAVPVPTVRCPTCNERTVVEYPIDQVAIRMAHIRHLNDRPDCARSRLARR
jgi:hypothetical protein